MKPEDIIDNYESKVNGATPESVLREESETMRRIADVGPLQKLLEQIRLAYGFVRDCAIGKYVGYSKKSLMVIVGGLAYLALPIDLVPDFIPAVGWLDDVIVLGWVFRQTAVELEKYQQSKSITD